MAVRKIMSNRSGDDGLTAEHLKHGGPTVVVWLKHIFNLIVSLEQVPCCLKLGVCSRARVATPYLATTTEASPSPQ